MWTKDRPTEPGWYWFRDDTPTTPRILHVFEVGGLSPCLVISNQFAENGVLPLKRIVGEWWPYPIARPGDEEKQG